MIGRLADHHGDNVSVELRHFVGQQLLVFAHRADIVEPKNIVRREHGMNPRHLASGRHIAFFDPRVRMG